MAADGVALSSTPSPFHFIDHVWAVGAMEEA